MGLFDSKVEKEIVVNFGKFSKEQARKLIGNKLELSLLMAEKFLTSIPEKINNTTERSNRLEFEMMSEGFLYFMIGARDALLQQINKTFVLGLDEDEVDLSSVLGKLDRTILSQQSVRSMLNDCTQTPLREIDGWNRNRSWLWEINHLRNRIGHISILRSAISVQVGSTEDPKASLIIYTPKNGHSLEEKKPKEYFTECIQKFVDLKDNIASLLPKPSQ